jgi:hypothetical protein
MIWHMRNMRSISIRIRNIVSGLDALLLLLLDIGLGELDKFLTFCVHPRVVLLTISVANPTLDVWPSCIQEDTPYIFYLFIITRIIIITEKSIFITSDIFGRGGSF